ncbi:AMP-binding protein [Actinoplanes derwentensis]|uniref:Acyl-CoA synthetase (AMP-forming)/AMP-acid ligase II n=1 Tax=Actinoplanes derwentensis TaxID=113562 RepID=A0A1H2CNY3_9ACTN|nr:AMP-binding protein [Actinoplanes derwentensis]GID88579.1 AMP-dependent acyl-CoA synthetase [Actinoplanes derwentensis]SDT71997.1 Acyl-CoA synthetase (AMP-forming)/AMP-acid ligase II [Actinoplanes derwentensis]
MNLLHPAARVVDAATGEILTRELIDAAERELPEKSPVFLAMTTTVPAIATYLAALRAGKPVLLLDPELDQTSLRARFTTDDVHPDLALLLTTSGSTGDPKLVRLSRAAVLANAEQVAESLGITGDDVAITTLPLFYSYGLSVLHSHLLRGATVILERTGIMQKDFWTAVNEHAVTSMAFVPSQYEMLRRLRFDPAKYPSLRTLTQAGGRLRAELIDDFAARMSTVDGRMFVMYGQTEAGPRMACLPSSSLTAKSGSVGLAMPGATFAIEDDEVVYRGPNVMMGYAETAADLARGDDQGGVLRTGDLGRLDDDGFLFLTGRIKRIGKVFGVRINLDDVEREFPVVAVAGDDKLHVFTLDTDTRALRTKIAEWLGTHFTGVDVRTIEALPLLPNGKTDYRALEASL